MASQSAEPPPGGVESELDELQRRYRMMEPRLRRRERSLEPARLCLGRLQLGHLALHGREQRRVLLLHRRSQLVKLGFSSGDDVGDGFVFDGDDAHGEVRLPARRVLQVLANGVERDAGVRGVLVSLPQLLA